MNCIGSFIGTGCLVSGSLAARSMEPPRVRGGRISIACCIIGIRRGVEKNPRKSCRDNGASFNFC